MSSSTSNYQYLTNPVQNIGGYKSVRIFHSSEIIQQIFQVKSVIKPPLKFLRNFSPVFSLDILKFEGGFEVGTVSDNSQNFDEETFSIAFDAQGTENEFSEFFNREFRRQNLCVELTTMNNAVLIRNPFRAKYTYLSAPTFREVARHQLSFERAKFIEYSQKFKIIKTVSVRTVNYISTISNECTIILLPNCSIDLFNYGYATTQKISDANFQANQSSNVLHNIADGLYYFFARNIQIPTIYDFIRFKVVAGVATIIDSDFYNPQIITEDETLMDEGITMPE
jgi:hypothetical protein